MSESNLESISETGSKSHTSVSGLITTILDDRPSRSTNVTITGNDSADVEMSWIFEFPRTFGSTYEKGWMSSSLHCLDCDRFVLVLFLAYILFLFLVLVLCFCF